MSLLQKSKAKKSARNQIDIKGVKDGVLQLPSRQYRATLQVSAVNFELKSEAEQDALIDTYESFLNSVGTPLQILIRTREIDLDRYLGEMHEQLANELDPVYQQQLVNYDEFIHSLVKTNKILTRNFYVVIPYTANRKLEFELVREQLNQTVDIVIKGLSRIGMYARKLTSLEVLDLFYSFYSPTQAKLQPLTDQALSLIHNSFIESTAV